MLTIQPCEANGRLPYPWHIDDAGEVLHQNFWKGNPSRLIGFALPGKYTIKYMQNQVTTENAAQVAATCLPVFENEGGGWETYLIQGYDLTFKESEEK